MKQQEIVTTFQRLDALGVRVFQPEELKNMYEELVKAIGIGIERTGEPTSEDGGLLAFPTYIKPISIGQVSEVPDGSPVITCACGGTNWMFAVATKQPNGNMKLTEPFILPIPEEERKHTFHSLADLIADEVLAVAKEYNLMEVKHLPIAISFGFPQYNVRMENGDIDARLNRRRLPKFWEITDLDESLPIEKQVSMSTLLRAALEKRGLSSIGSIVFVNDTVAVALDVQHGDGADLPVGFVFGTGTNGAMYGNNEKGIVNLEIGHAKVVIRDSILDIMEREEFVPTATGIMEYWMGGGYLPGRLAASVLALSPEFLDPSQVADSIINSTNQAIVSEIAEDASPRQLQLHIGPSEYTIIQESAKRVLQQAGQLIGLHIAAVCYAAGYRSGLAHVPYEGSLLAKGFGVAAMAEATVKSLLPESDIRPYRASGILGIAKLALLLSIARLPKPHEQ